MSEVQKSLLGLGLACFLALAGCDGPVVETDGGIDATTPQTDSGPLPLDAGFDDDAGSDAGPVITDGGVDGGSESDAGSDAGPADSCSDGAQNGDETDVDCGGPTCATRCEADQSCAGSADCASHVCISGTCIAASCTDGIRNGDETDRDCGGSCDPCENGQMCGDMADCADSTAMCTGGFCQPGGCVDGMQDGDETDVDCGGDECGPCASGGACELARDCQSGICTGHVCVPAECTNGTMDGTEIGVDCGGDCPGCPDGTACTDAAQCLSGRCEGGVCTSCSDGMMSGAETDVDCGGGVCSGCSGGRACVGNTDCRFGTCLPDNTCNGPTAFYQEDFEGGAGGWVADTGASWELGTPAGDVVQTAHSGVNAWATNIAGEYGTFEDGYVVSPVIDLSAATEDPIVELAVAYDTERNFDAALLEMSTDGGTSWDVVGDVEDGVNWYDTDSGWTGHDHDDEGWRIAKALLTGAAGQSTVQLRFHFVSDRSVTYDGFAFDDVTIRTAIPNLSVSVRVVPDVCGEVVATVANLGDVAVPSATFRYGIGAALTTVSLTDFALGATETRTISASNGDTVTAEVTSASDANPTDNDATVTLGSVFIPVSAASPYAEDFDSGDGGWITTGDESSWEHGVPAGTTIASADSGTMAWVTNLDGDYNADEFSYLVSPCFDATSATADLRVSFAHIYETEGCCDEGWIEYSVDGGRSWDTVVGDSTATNWYNDTSSDEWDHASTGWETASASLPGTAGKQQVRIRHVTSADGSGQFEGFGVDTVRIEPFGAPDLSVEMRRTASCGTVEAVVTNEGTSTATAYALTLTADGSSTRMTVIETLAPGDAVVYPIDVLAEGGASVEAPGDTDPSNDSATLRSSILVTGGFFEDFEADDGDFTAGGTNASWEHGAPAGAFISRAASGTNAWVTTLDGPYSSDEHSTLTSPCFDFSGLSTDPQLSFAQIFQTEACCDHGWVEMSTDGGSTWRQLGRSGEGTNWYSDPVLDWWSGTSGTAGTWRTASHALTGAAGSTQVQFRFVMYSDGAIESEGFGIDDVSIMP